MNQLIEVCCKPEAIRLDNGPELTAEAFVDCAKEHGVRLLFIQSGNPNQNALVERFNRSFGKEVLDACLFTLSAKSGNRRRLDGRLQRVPTAREPRQLGSAVFKHGFSTRTFLLAS